MPLLVLSFCLTCRFRVTVSVLLSLVGPAHQLLVGFFDVAARLCPGDGPIAALVGGPSCNIGSAFQHRTCNDYKVTSQYRLLSSTEEGKYDGAVQ